MEVKERYNFIQRLLILAPLVLLISPFWVLISIFSSRSLGRILKRTGENLLK